MFPYMLVNIGSGVSILKVTGQNKYERISGTSLGGGTFWGLMHLISGSHSFDEILEISKTGDNKNVDMLVGDIYGVGYDKIGLKATAIASTMGGVYRAGLSKKYEKKDIAASLLYMVSNNIGQIAYLNAQLHGIKRIYFGGYFIRGHKLTMHTLSYAINFWSKGTMNALFLRHEGFLGAVGAFIKADPSLLPSKPTHSRRGGSFTENFVVAKEVMMNVGKDKVDHPKGSVFGILDRVSSKLVPLPQLILSSKTKGGDSVKDQVKIDQTTPHTYQPDTLDLTSQKKLREYLIDTMNENVSNLVEMAESRKLKISTNGSSKPKEGSDIVAPESESESASASASVPELPLQTEAGATDKKEITPAISPSDRLLEFKNLFSSRLDTLLHEPAAYGKLTIRSILNLKEQCLQICGFRDLFFEIKQKETNDAIAVLPGLLSQLDQITDRRELVKTLLDRMIVGNMFDWGSTEISSLMVNHAMSFENAKSKIIYNQKLNNSDKLADKLAAHSSSSSHGDNDSYDHAVYNQAVIFVDNAGADLVLGVIPFARFLLRCGTKVILAANSLPSVNDITCPELTDLVLKIAEFDSTFQKSIENGNLQVCPTGSQGPCLDLSRLDERLVNRCPDADFIVIVGMGRAIHTNYHATFNVDCLKVAVFKSRLAAGAMGVDLYTGLCKFTPASLPTRHK
ncbi:Pantothenate kinase 2 [Zancudomyces culisetae]|uniref:pantothenate kinase n=1 Tax=Zancudomyces culisetae TaxID=1213189 RepID=A0A1R1PK82_ZANCU|nr:Pantothenate kinase 2 [Zancudomyces culisetae]|eukprot:OMH81380.1 Pantothenate kinase 2 [Zancudomyces culisetae]